MTTLEIYMLAVVFFVGGIVKGTLGIGLPALLVGLLTFFYEPRLSVAMILFVIMATNFRQALIGENVLMIIKRHKYFCLFACIGIFITSIVGANVPLQLLLICVGLSMSVFALTSLFANIPKLPDRHNKPAQIIAGIGSGIMGGLTAIWGPPLAIYLMSLKLKKNEFIQTLGVMFSVQSIFLVAGFLISGELTGQVAKTGLLAIIPAFVGMYFGEKIRTKLNTQQFMRGFLIIFLLLGLNLIRRGFFGS